MMKTYKGLQVPVEPKIEWKAWMLRDNACQLSVNCRSRITCMNCIYSCANIKQRKSFYKKTFKEEDMKTYKGLQVPVEPKREWKEWMLSKGTCQMTVDEANCGDIASCMNCIYSYFNMKQRESFYKETFKEEEEVKTSNSQELIAKKCDELKELLLEKNRKYGDSALNPVRIFSKADAKEQIRVRIDDKLNRIKNEQNDEDEDVIKDLAGYCILYMVANDKK